MQMWYLKRGQVVGHVVLASSLSSTALSAEHEGGLQLRRHLHVFGMSRLVSRWHNELILRILDTILFWIVPVYGLCSEKREESARVPFPDVREKLVPLARSSRLEATYSTIVVSRTGSRETTFVYLSTPAFGVIFPEPGERHPMRTFVISSESQDKAATESGRRIERSFADCN